MEVVDSLGDTEHDFENRDERRGGDGTDVVEEIPVGAQLGDDHEGDQTRFLRDRNSDEVYDVGVAKVTKQPEFFDVHVGEVTSNVGDGDHLLAIETLVDILRKRKAS